MAGLDESELCVGDQLRIGGVLLAVTQPRTPCFKLALRLQAADLPRRFSSHARTGCYLRVLEEGLLAAGDAVERVALGHGHVPVCALFRACLNPHGEGATAILRRAIGVPELSATWRRKAARRLEACR